MTTDNGDHTRPLPSKLTLDAFQVMPNPTPEEFATLKESIRSEGQIIYPLVIDASGQMIDGHTRYRAYLELLQEGAEVTKPRVIVRRDVVTDYHKRALARSLNASRRQMKPTQKRRLIREQLFDTPHWADTRIANTCGVTPRMVRRVREAMEEAGEISFYSQFETTNGSMVKRSRAPKESMEIVSRRLQTGKIVADVEDSSKYAPSARGALAAKVNQSAEAKQERKLKNALRKAVYALSHLAEATSEDPELVAMQTTEEECRWLNDVYGQAGGWLDMFMLYLGERSNRINE